MRELICPKHMCKIPLGKCMEWDLDETTGQKVQCEEKPVMSTTLYWCSKCNIPIYEEYCPECGSKGEYIATDIRPVFPEEKVLLAILLEKENPLCFENASVWNNTNYYIVNGEKLQIYNDMFVSFSGGKNSTVTSDIVGRALSSNKIYHIFGDTTLEFPLTYEYKKQFAHEHRMLLAKNYEKNFENLCGQIGPPSRVMRWG